MPEREGRQPLRRLPRASIAAAYLERASSTAGLLAVGAVASTGSSGWLDERVWLLIGPLLVLRLLHPWYTWAALEFRIEESGLSVVHGLVNRRARHVAWSAVRAVEMDQPWSLRVLGLTRVGLLQGGEEATKVLLPAVSEDTRIEVVARARHGSDGSPDGLGGAARPTGGREATAIYRASVPELLIASLVYGKFATIGAGLALAAADLLDQLQLMGPLRRLSESQPILIGAVAALVVMTAGAVLTVVQFAGLEAEGDADSVVLRYGSISRRERVVGRDAIVGFVVHRNLLETLLDRVRLSLITTDSSASLGSNLVLPSLRREVVLRIVSGTFADSGVHRVVGGLDRRTALVRRGAALAGFGLIVIGAIWVAYEQTRTSRLLALVLAVAFIALARAAGAFAFSRLALGAGGRFVRLRTAFLTEQEHFVDLDFVHLFSAFSVAGRTRVVRAHYYAGTARALSAARFDAADVSEITRTVSRHGRLIDFDTSGARR